MMMTRRWWKKRMTGRRGCIYEKNEPIFPYTAMAGGLAGGFSNLVLYPIDVAKTLRQSDPASHPTSLAAILLKQAR
jgi:Mitochondrial carrier protein